MSNYNKLSVYVLKIIYAYIYIKFNYVFKVCFHNSKIIEIINKK